ncbi:TRAP transporter large permease [Corynebacterium sp. 320]|uniref:TRAP transporter large permease n=1 Tax=Corynebacterium TaxID=1716 RepID=UPI00125CBCA0|nr:MULTISPECIES: TRAP transporter large permease [Corynebacterium]KAB1503128.1 TRAP transporter large permease [Corynebacterium sp. 320]KAB1550658.1 TRAP transporter large permease [Corynebacterium sp. 321]KAB1551020.1 TRAP transporter large permease [Corynebacterium sp. 319]KAB3526925.1 TRAP transporter large permease [Corynebacterium sp. 250]KAB3538418.1 TRAP transporter large permease [Corynebacterium sp. 366]
MLVVGILIVLVALIVFRVPVSFAILASGLLGLTILEGFPAALHTLETSPFAAVRSNSLSAIPLFILMAQLLLMSGLLDSLFDAARSLIGRLPGGTAIASVGAGTAFAAVSGSSTAAAATLAQTSSVRMMKEGYARGTATGLVAVVGTLAAMIPPSIILVFYAITAEAPVGQVLIAGFFPGLLVACGLIVTMYLGFLRDRSVAPAGSSSTIREKLTHVWKASPLLVIFCAVVGSIFFGIATPTEAATLGTIAALILVVAKGKWDRDQFGVAVLETVKTSAMIFAIIMTAHVLGDFLTLSRVTPRLVASISEAAWPPLVVMALIGLVYMVLGFFMDQIAIIALTVPMTLPIVEELGYDPIWFGIFVVLLAETGMVTPPMGINVFVVSKAVKISPVVVFRGAFPYVLVMLLIAAAALLWPDLVMWVPNLSSASG